MLDLPVTTINEITDKRETIISLHFLSNKNIKIENMLV